MSALAPVLEPTLDLRPPVSLTPLESALTDCYLSCKQNALLSPLESALTNPSHLPDSAHLKTLCFDTLSDHCPVTPLESALTKNRGGGGYPPQSLLRRVNATGSSLKLGGRPATGNTVYADRNAAYSLDALYFAAGEILCPITI